MKVLIIATKSPWPPIDGGRLLLLQRLEALAAAAVHTVLVAPIGPGSGWEEVARHLAPLCDPRLVPVEAAGRLRTLTRMLRSGVPFTIARHHVPEVVREARAVIARDRIEVLHAEQLQAFSNAEQAGGGRLPIVLSTQNVESDLWAAAARTPLMRFEARRLARWEGEAVGRATLSIALTSRDQSRLTELARAVGRHAEPQECPPPFPPELPPGPSALPGAPAILLMGSARWYPNQESTRWFVRSVWPLVRAALPQAVLHVFGDAGSGDGEGVTHHASPEDSATAFVPNGVLVVPLRIGSGVRMKVLEAWARGVPVVATPEALAGLEVEDGREALVAREAADFVVAFQRLQREAGLRAALVAGGSAMLRRRHDPEAGGRALLAIYEQALASSRRNEASPPSS